MNHKACLFLGPCLAMLVAGCQVNHTLSDPGIRAQPALPELNVVVTGPVPGELIRNRMRSLGVFEQVREGYDPAGYNLRVHTRGDYLGIRNLPNQLLSALTLFIVPASVSWDTQIDVLLALGDDTLARYRVDNRSTHYNGLFVHPDGRGENIRILTDTVVARLQTDAELFQKQRLQALYRPTPMAPPGLAQPVQVTAMLEVRSDGSVGDVQLTGEMDDAVRTTVASQLQAWRFRPWSTSGERPETQTVTRRFTLASARSGDPLQQTLQQPCSLVIAELQQFEEQAPGQPLQQMTTFQRTSAVLVLADLGRNRTGGAAVRSDHAFVTALPWIIEQCRANPTDQYQHYVFEGIRRELSAVPLLEQTLEHRRVP